MTVGQAVTLTTPSTRLQSKRIHSRDSPIIESADPLVSPLYLESTFLPVRLVLDISLENKLALLRERIDDHCGTQAFNLSKVEKKAIGEMLTIKDRHVVPSVLLQEDQHLVTQLNQRLEIGRKVHLEPVITMSASFSSGRHEFEEATHVKLSEMGPDRRMF